jgi:hypothetical protein
MPLYSSFYPVPMGQDSGLSSISGEFNESGEVTYVQCSSGEETYPNLIASIASNNGDVLAPQPTSLYVDTPAAESFVSQSSTNSVGYFDTALHGQGENNGNENENWIDDCGEYNEGVLMSCTAPSFTTHQFATGETPFYTTNYENIREHATTPAPFNFAPSTPPTFSHSTHHA